MAVGLLALPGCGGGPARGAAGDVLEANSVVVRVVDGDTVVVRLDGAEQPVRLIGIDTPETVDPRRPPECFGAEASEATSRLLPPGTRVRLVRDAEVRDRYDRLLAYVYRASDGELINLALVAGGYASSSAYPPNTALQARLDDAETGARERRAGLWGACPDPPG